MLEKAKLDILTSAIVELGRNAKAKQKALCVDFKADGSAVTQIDLENNRKIKTLIEELFPECTFISEELPSAVKKSAPYIFILDPIDGTDVYSQGLPSFALALGILDNAHNPVGGIIFAPRFGVAKEELLITLYPDDELYIDGVKFEGLPESKDHCDQCTISSRFYQQYDFNAYKHKLRSFGSGILHTVSPLIFSNITCSVMTKCYVWDLLAAHAIMKKAGFEMEYIDGEEFIYEDDFVYEKKPLKKDLFIGRPPVIEEMRRTLIKL